MKFKSMRLWFCLTFALLLSTQFYCSAVQADSEITTAGVKSAHIFNDGIEFNKKGIVILVHGLSQHSGSLGLLRDELLAEGFIVATIDQRGHGNWHSPEREGAEGYRCDFKKTSSDLNRLALELKEQHGRLPIFFIGESIGASVVLRSAGDLQETVNGVILCSCGAKCSRFKTSWIIKDCISALLRPFSEISVKKYQAKYACENPEVLKQTLLDKKARSGFRPKEVFRINRFFAQNRKFARRLEPATDLLILSGELDNLTTPEQCQKLLDAAQSNQKSLISIANSGHMMIGRPDLFPQTKRVVSNWLAAEANRKLASGSKN